MVGNLATEVSTMAHFQKRPCCCFTGTPNNRICKVNLPLQQGCATWCLDLWNSIFFEVERVSSYIIMCSSTRIWSLSLYITCIHLHCSRPESEEKRPDHTFGLLGLGCNQMMCTYTHKCTYTLDKQKHTNAKMECLVTGWLVRKRLVVKGWFDYHFRKKM